MSRAGRRRPQQRAGPGHRRTRAEKPWRSIEYPALRPGRSDQAEFAFARHIALRHGTV